MEVDMKTNLHAVNYDGTPNHNGRWWVWKETCDRCGKLIQDETTQSSCPGDESQLDFCIECYRYLFDNNIEYDQALTMFLPQRNKQK